MTITTCQICGDDFTGDPRRISCSDKCTNIRKLRNRAARRLGNCEICGDPAWRRKAYYGPRCEACFEMQACSVCGVPSHLREWNGACDFCRLHPCVRCGEITDKATLCTECAAPDISQPRHCIFCGDVFIGVHSDRKYCSQACRDSAREDRHKAANQGKARSRRPVVLTDEWIAREKARQARRRGALTAGPVSRDEIFERDGYVCQLCDEPVDLDLKFPDPGFGTLDHIIPIAKGGSHTLWNLQLAHFLCNQRKSDKLPDLAQLPLF